MIVHINLYNVNTANNFKKSLTNKLNFNKKALKINNTFLNKINKAYGVQTYDGYIDENNDIIIVTNNKSDNREVKVKLNLDVYKRLYAKNTMKGVQKKEILYPNFIKMVKKDMTGVVNDSMDFNTTGIVIGFKDFIVTIKGLNNVQLNEMIHFENGASGLILSLEEDSVKGIVFSGARDITTGSIAYRTNSVMVVGVGEALLGRVVNALGEPLDGGININFNTYMRVERKAPGVITRKKVSEPLTTGLKVVDALVPIGRGQRELILGDRKTGKTTVAIDTILNQRLLVELGESPLLCFYVAIGKRLSEIMRIAKMLKDKGSFSYTSIIAAPASDPASLQFIAPYSACTMAEYFTYKGKHSLIIYDDLSKHADAYRQLALLLRRPVGREAYPGDIFYLHSRLLERAVKMNSDYLSGSLTALPIVETVQGDVSAYIPTNVISITDGQIYLDLNMHQEGVRPAVDPGISVSRVGSSAQYKSMKALAGSLKLELAQYREVAQFSKFGSELDAATRKVLAKGRLLIELLKQPRNLPIIVFKQVLVLYAASSGFLDFLLERNINLSDYQRNLFLFLDQSYIVTPFKRYINLHIDNTLFNFILNYHYDFWLQEQSMLVTSGYTFKDELAVGFKLNVQYSTLVKRVLLNEETQLTDILNKTKKSDIKLFFKLHSNIYKTSMELNELHTLLNANKTKPSLVKYLNVLTF